VFRPGTPMPDVFHEMSKKGLGMTTVLEPDGRLAVDSDGCDLRRLMEKHRGPALGEMTPGSDDEGGRPDDRTARCSRSEALQNHGDGIAPFQQRYGEGISTASPRSCSPWARDSTNTPLPLR